MGLTRQTGGAGLDAEGAPKGRGAKRRVNRAQRSCATDARSAPRRGEERSDESNQVYDARRASCRTKRRNWGEVPEWSNGPDSKSGVRFAYRGFESLPLRQKYKGALAAPFAHRWQTSQSVDTAISSLNHSRASCGRDAPRSTTPRCICRQRLRACDRVRPRRK